MRQHGHATTEWIIATAVLAAALFLPVDGEKSTVALMIHAIRDFYANSTFSLALP